MPTAELTPDQVTRNRLAEEHLYVAHDVAAKIARRTVSVEFSDVVGHAYLGLLDAAERFDPSLGVAFPAYAYARVRGAVYDGLRSLDQAPRSRRVKERDARSAQAKLEAQLGREVEPAEVAAELGITVDEAQSRMQRHGTKPVAQEDMERLPLTDESSTHDTVAEAELIAVIAAAVRRLPDNPRAVVQMCVIEGATLAEAAAALGLSESRACQIRASAIDALRMALADHGAAAPRSTSSSKGGTHVVKHLRESLDRAPLRKRTLLDGRVVASRLALDPVDAGDIDLAELERLAA